MQSFPCHIRNGRNWDDYNQHSLCGLRHLIHAETDPPARLRFNGFSDGGAESTKGRLDLIHRAPTPSISSAAINAFNSFHRTRPPSASMTNWVCSVARRGRCELPDGRPSGVRPRGDDGRTAERAASATPLFRTRQVYRWLRSRKTPVACARRSLVSTTCSSRSTYTIRSCGWLEMTTIEMATYRVIYDSAALQCSAWGRSCSAFYWQF